MTPHALTDTLSQIVLGVPGVAFLTPGLAGRLTSAFHDPGQNRSPGAGMKVERPGGSGPWQVDVRIVMLSGSRAQDVTRATRSAVMTHLRTDGAAVTVTITGIV
ncbi:hypothetical protein [Streptomyces sp. NPDC003952]